jgi:hypothetical protein
LGRKYLKTTKTHFPPTNQCQSEFEKVFFVLNNNKKKGIYCLMKKSDGKFMPAIRDMNCLYIKKGKWVRKYLYTTHKWRLAVFIMVSFLIKEINVSHILKLQCLSILGSCLMVQCSQRITEEKTKPWILTAMFCFRNLKRQLTTNETKHTFIPYFRWYNWLKCEKEIIQYFL